jgi:hypothetical protein
VFAGDNPYDKADKQNTMPCRNRAILSAFHLCPVLVSSPHPNHICVLQAPLCPAVVGESVCRIRVPHNHACNLSHRFSNELAVDIGIWEKHDREQQLQRRLCKLHNKTALIEMEARDLHDHLGSPGNYICSNDGF